MFTYKNHQLYLQTSELNESKLKTVIIDSGYRGRKVVHDVSIQIPKPFTKKQTEVKKSDSRRHIQEEQQSNPLLDI
jgi:hypothetical protein